MKKTTISIISAGCILLLTQCNLFQHEVKTEQPVPTDRETVKIGTASKSYVSKDLAKGTIEGDWAIDEVAGKKAKGESAPFLKFRPDEKAVYGNNGCNVVNGSYSYSPADSTLQFSGLITTMKACATAGLTDFEINTALGATRYYSWEENESLHRLHFYDASRREVMVLTHQNFQFLNGPWVVTRLNGQETGDTDMKLVFDIDEMKIHGNTGCNILNGSLETNLETANTISFQQIATTRMACPDPSKETALLVALEEAMYVKPVGKDKVQFLDSREKVIMELDRVQGIE